MVHHAPRRSVGQVQKLFSISRPFEAALFARRATGDRPESIRFPLTSTAWPLAAKENAQNHLAYAKYVAIEQLRQTMRDPDSLVVEFAGVTEDATTVCIQYRAKNGFGDYDKAIAIDTAGRIASDVSTWNRLCAQRLYDVEGPGA